jgi:type IV pilus assembly protein PilE
MERYYTTNLTYTGAVAPSLGCSTESNMAQRYTFTMPTPGAKTYTVTATAIKAQLKDTKCLTLTIDQAGGRTSTGGGTCW